MFNRVKKENGSVTIEATISLSTFMFAIVTILSIVNVCVVQAKMSYAINTTAKEISQYSYIYSLTGLNDSQKRLEEAGIEGTKDISKILADVNTVYNEIENLGNTGNQTPENINDIMSAWDGAVGSVEKIEGAGSSLYDTISGIAKDPKNLMFGIAKLAASEGLDLAKSRLIAAPLAKVMVQKHLVNTKDGDVNSYLKFLGVVPSATGSYLDGLDFTQSSLFPNGSSEIKINVSYDVKVIALLPIDLVFHFNQTAITHGWLAGEDTHENRSSKSLIENNTLWTEATVSERSSLIRHLVIEDLEDEGYKKTTKLTDVQMYNSEKNEFVMISSMNPLWSPKDLEPVKIEDLSDIALQNNIELLCGKMKSTTDGLDNVTTKIKKDGIATKTEQKCTGAQNKIVLVIPEDEGLKEKIESIIAKSNTRGVTVEVVPSFGTGVNKIETEADGEGGAEGGTGE